MKTIIVGGGIGGLATAVALSRRGHDVEVLERAPEFEAAGTALSLWPNAMSALDALGVGDAVRDRAHLTRGAIRSAAGRRLADLGTEDAAVVRRADLIEVLRDATPKGVIKTGVEVNEVNDSAVVHTKGESRGELLVGADGIHSLVRRSLWHDPPAPRYAGYTAWRMIVPVRVDEAVETWGRGQRFGFAPLTGGDAYAFAAVNAPEGAPDGGAGGLREWFGGWPDPIPRILEAMEEPLHDDLYELPPLRGYTSGDAVLVGDAAHAMTPDLGQGAGQALEDAVVLAATMNDRDEYDRLRRPRTQMIARRSRRVGRMGQLSRGAALRDLTVRHTPREAFARSLAPVLDWTPPKEPDSPQRSSR